MGYSSARSHAIELVGLSGAPVTVEAHSADGLPNFVFTGLPDTVASQGRERVRAALRSTGTPLPAQRVTVNLAPASMPKAGTGYDLCIAIALLAANGVIDAAGPERTVHIGELGLDGSVRGVSGVLPVVAAAARAGFARVMVPHESAAEAELIEGIEVVPVASLRQAALLYGADVSALEAEPASEPAMPAAVSLASGPPVHALRRRDLADVVGNEVALRGLEIAAAGGHHLVMVGPPGSGKTMLAERFVDLLPDLDIDRAIEVAAIRSLRGFPPSSPLDRRPPLQAPHHTASQVALIGGGSGAIRPGAVSLANHGVLFIDEAPEFPRGVLDAMRQALESGVQEVHRQRGVVAFPARFQLVLAANPCPCGNAGSVEVRCSCEPRQQRAYFARLSGPLLDRIDVQLRVERVSPARQRVARDAGSPSSSTSTAVVRRRVEAARAAARARLASTPWRTNAEVDGQWFRTAPNQLPPVDRESLDRALDRGFLTRRGHDRVLRVAWSIADLAGVDRPKREHVQEALFFRTSMGGHE